MGCYHTPQSDVSGRPERRLGRTLSAIGTKRTFGPHQRLSAIGVTPDVGKPLMVPLLSHALEQSDACVIAEQLRIPHVAAQGVHALVAACVHHLEY